ncbi:MAG TPA: RDD family protein, partial [Phycisphaerae bacterium]|nr:RDD family protein [Phycisphaerae bacterium]
GGPAATAGPATVSAAPRLVLARFYPSDGQWHVEWEVAPPVAWTDATRSVGLARFRDRLVAAEYDGRAIRAHEVAFVASQGDPPPPLPETSIVLPVAAAQGGWIQNSLMIAAMVLVTVLAIRGYRQRIMPRPGLPDDEYRRRAAMAAAYQVEKFMYLPVLVRRGMAFLLDALVVVLVVAVIVIAVEAPRRPDLFLSGQTADPRTLMNSMNLVLMKGLFNAVMLVYFLGTELILGRTPGKLIFGLMIVDADDRRPAWWRIVDRNLLRLLEVVLVPVALLIILWTPRSQRLGDLLGGTRVVMAVRRTDRFISPQAPRTM